METQILKIDEFNKLNKTGYTGYFWYSDKTEPKVNDFSELELSENQVPFIIEGYLYNESEQECISIKNFNGEYHITKFNINEIVKNDEKYQLSDPETVPAINKLADNKNLKIRRLQEKITDDLGFYSWQDVADIFVGFEEKTNSKN